MSGHQLEYIDALLDGQLTVCRRWRIARHLRACPLCAAQYRKQRHVRRLLRENPPRVQMSDSAEFFWSKVKTEIERREPEPVPVNAPVPRLGFGNWLQSRQYALAAVATVVCVALGCLFVLTRRPPADRLSARSPDGRPAATHEATCSWPHAVATVLPAETPQVTVIWVSGLPWTSDMTQMQTLYAHPYDYLDI